MATKPGMPYADSRIAKYLSKQIDTLAGRKSQREIAQEIGYDKPNMISMFKRGECKIPLDKVPALAKSVEADPAFLFRLAMEQFWPDGNNPINTIFGTVLTRNETEIILHVRKESGETDPALTPELAQAIAAAVKLSA